MNRASEVIELRLERDDALEWCRAASLGALTPGFLHALNNSLVAVLGPVELLLEDAGADSALRERLERIRGAALDSRDLSRALAGAAREPVAEPCRLSLTDVCASVVELARRTMSRRLEVVERYPAEPVEVEASPSELTQIVLALLAGAEGSVELVLSPEGESARVVVSPAPREGLALDVARALAHLQGGELERGTLTLPVAR